jgi:hypothetical protein
MLVKRGATWKYLDDGLDQGTAWREIRFNDKAWKRGPAELGYGDRDERTKVSFGPDKKNKFITTYFRHAFEVDKPDAIRTVVLRLKRDDGAVVYLNGKEVVRSGMPNYAPNYRTRALYSAEMESRYLEFQVEPAPLVRGNNLLAVEVHQRSGTSSDISFDLELETGGVAKPTREPPARDADMKPDCEVLSEGSWYVAKILKREGKERWYIHYVGYGSDEDELVGKKRIRFLKAEGK